MKEYVYVYVCGSCNRYAEEKSQIWVIQSFDLVVCKPTRLTECETCISSWIVVVRYASNSANIQNFPSHSSRSCIFGT